MPEPEDLRYARTHEWVYEDHGVATVGITDHAQEELGDVALILLPEVGQVLHEGDKFGEIESIKAVSDLYAPVSGTVVAVNELLHDHPEWVNENPLNDGWMIRIKMTSLEELGALLDVNEYEAIAREH